MQLTWTDQPERALWDQIMVYSHAGNVLSLLNGNLNSKRQQVQGQCNITEKATQAAFAIQQANEYFAAAKHVTISTSPLLYYYGMLSLTKALIVCNSRSLLLDDIKYHGLTTKSSNSVPSTSNLSDQGAKIAGGVFCELLKLSRLSSSQCQEGAKLRLLDILRVDPQLGHLFDRQFAETSGVVPLYQSDNTNDGRTIVEVTSHEEAFKRRFPSLVENVTFATGYIPSAIKVIGNKDFTFETAATVYSVRAGGSELRANPVSTDRLGKSTTEYYSVEECDFVAMYILSDCVRYKQSMWRDCQVSGKDTCFPLIGSFISNAIRRYPNYILDSLLGETHEFGTVGYTA